MSGKLLVGALIAALVLVLVPVGASAAGPVRPATVSKGVHTGHGMSAQLVALMKVQAGLDVAADRIDAAAKAGGVSGLAGVEVSARDDALTVHWHGAVPQRVADTLARERAAGIHVTLAPAAYSHDQLDLEARRIQRDTSGTRIAPSAIRVNTVTVRADGAGLDVGVDGPGATTAASVERAVPALASGVRVNVVHGAAPVADFREADTEPYWGGDLIASSSSDCTGGFAVTKVGQQFLMTAAHCSPNPSQDTWKTGAGTTIGPVNFWNSTHDAMLIGPTVSDGVIYRGSSIVDDTLQAAIDVGGMSASHVGDVVCDSGSFSGEVCGIQVTATGVSFSITEGSTSMTFFDMVQGDQQQHTDASGSGDSGGPFFSLNADGSRAIARGTVTAHDTSTNVACQGVAAVNGRTCGWRTFYPDITFQLQDTGASLLTH